MKISVIIAGLTYFAATHVEAQLEALVLPRVAVVEREGITGAGQVVQAGKRLLVLYPNHPDDFGGTGGSGASVTEDGGATWQSQPDDWPLGKTVDVWADRLRNGDLIAIGLRWAPDPKKRGELGAKDVPADAYQLGISTDGGRTWRKEPMVIEHPAAFGIIARPLPHVFEDESGVLFMPAYSWGKSGNHALLLHSKDRGKHWSVLSSITTAAAMVKAGARVTTPWLETTVSRTQSGDFLAIVRTGSSAKSSLVSVRSTDHGKTWSTPEKLSLGGKLPTLQLLPNGTLALLTAHTKNHCRLYFSADGNGREWSTAHVLSSQSGGNAGMTVTGKDSLLVISPANKRIDAWRVSLRASPAVADSLSSPKDIAFNKGALTWSSTAAAHEVTPVLIEKATGYDDTEILAHAPIRVEGTKLDLGRQLLIGATYVFEVRAVDSEGRASPPARSAPLVNL
ncbi:MAG: glycoside hydrolase [Verrucomicrobiaceae bacterium]|nr:glycoside hydrolase [Verrucomicrobiaceae bacterium]